jgi:hypothetical protein
LLASTQWVVVRYFVPLLPLFAILTGRLVVAALETPRTVVRIAATAALVFALTANGLALGIYGAAIAEPDRRDAALVWLLKHYPAGTRIGVLQGYDGDVYFHPPAIAQYSWSACVLSSCDMQSFLAEPKDLLVIADNYLDAETTMPDGERRTVAAMLAAQTIYTPGERFAPQLNRLGYDVQSQFSASDLRHALPALTIYRRRP